MWDASRVVESSRCPWFSTQDVTRRTLEHFLRSRQHDSDTQQTGRNSSSRVYGRVVRLRLIAWTPITTCLPPLWTSHVTDGSDIASAPSAARNLCLKGLIGNLGPCTFMCCDGMYTYRVSERSVDRGSCSLVGRPCDRWIVVDAERTPLCVGVSSASIPQVIPYTFTVFHQPYTDGSGRIGFPDSDGSGGQVARADRCQRRHICTRQS